MENRRFRKLASALTIWLGLVTILAVWWGTLLLRQAKRIAELERQIGLSSSMTLDHWERTQRMLFWEAGTFISLLLASTSLLFWLYWQDARRAKSIRSFFASFTHELRTPLTSIRLQAEMIAENLSGKSEEGLLVRRLLEDSLRLEAQVERTLELARVEGGGPVFTQAFPLKPWLDRFLSIWILDYQDRVFLETDVEDLLVEADPAAVQIIFKNLLENSIRHSEKEQVLINIRVKSDPKGGVRVLVQDNGLGYLGDQRKLGKLFQKGAHSQGTGVGLYLVNALMKRMKGFAEYANPPGFCVSLWLPEGKTHA